MCGVRTRPSVHPSVAARLTITNIKAKNNLNLFIFVRNCLVFVVGIFYFLFCSIFLLCVGNCNCIVNAIYLINYNFLSKDRYYF